MKLLAHKILLTLCSSAALTSADMHGGGESSPETIVPKVEEVVYQDKDGASLTGFMAVPDSAPSAPVPAVIIIP